MQTASKSLMEAIADVYESQWTGADALIAQTQQVDSLWQDFSHKLGDQVLIPLNTYTAQFPEMKVGKPNTFALSKHFAHCYIDRVQIYVLFDVNELILFSSKTQQALVVCKWLNIWALNESNYCSLFH